MVTEAGVLEALKACYDPEIPVNIVDLGLVYGVDIQGDKVQVRMTLTAPGCPMHRTIAQDVERRLLQLEGVRQAMVNMVWEPRWTPARMSPQARRSLGFKE